MIMPERYCVSFGKAEKLSSPIEPAQVQHHFFVSDFLIIFAL